MKEKKTAVFVFPNAAGHVNPSLPLCQRLVETGWQVEYLAVDIFKTAIESTGARFHDRNALCAEYGFHNLKEITLKSFDDYGSPGAKMWALNFGSIMTEKLLPVYIDFLRKHKPCVVVYCPVLCQVAHFAALHLRIPDVSLLTAAGPGYWDAAFASPAANGASAVGLVTAIKACEPNMLAVKSIREQIGEIGNNLTLNTDVKKPVVCDYYTGVNIVTTIESLADKLNEKDAQYYSKKGQTFEFVGPLMFSSASTKQATVAPSLSEESIKALFTQVDNVMAVGRSIVYVSLGTVLTSAQDSTYGWNGYAVNSSISGKELCQAVFRAVFEVLGCNDGEEPAESKKPLIIVSTGSQPDALSGLCVPPNAICLPSVPQVRLLQKVNGHKDSPLAAIITHGGQNSFMESLSVGAPIIVCPGFGDQIANAIRTESLGVGVKIDRPQSKLRKRTGDDIDNVTEDINIETEEKIAVTSYTKAVVNAIEHVMGQSHRGFLAKAKAISTELQKAGGVDQAVQIVLNVSETKN